MDLHQAAADRLGRIDAVDLAVRAVDQGEPAVAIDRADGCRHGVDQAPQAALAGLQRGLVLLGVRRQLARQVLGALLEQLLLLAQGQEVAGAGAELEMVDRAEQKVGGAGLERLIAVAAVLIDRDHHHRHVAARPGGGERRG